MLEAARAKGFPANVVFLEADAASIPLPAAGFDLVICNATFPHLPDKARALAEMARVLKSGGQLAICHTNSRERVNTLHKEIGGAVAGDEIPEEPEMRQLLAEAGLERISVCDEESLYLATARMPASPDGTRLRAGIGPAGQ
jgi:ubiquinone/menaquinone biosynthesis C-methylase UbiE